MTTGGKAFSTAVVLTAFTVLCVTPVPAQMQSVALGRFHDSPMADQLSVDPALPAIRLADNSLTVKVTGLGGIDLPSLVHLELTFEDPIAATRAGVLRDAYCNLKCEYSFGQLPDGLYVVSASVAGFLPQHAEVHLYHGTVRQLMITLRRAGSTPDVASDGGTVSISWLAVAEKARKLYMKAVGQFRKKNYDRTIQFLEDALQLDSNFAQAYNQLGLTYWAQGDREHAEEFFRMAIAKDNTLFDAPLNLAQFLITKQSYAEAQQILEQAVRKHPSRAEPFLLLGRVLYLEGDLDKAEAASKQAFERDANNTAEAHLVLANVYMKRNKPGAAAEQLEAYLSAAPKGRYALVVRGLLDKLAERRAADPATAPAASAATSAYTTRTAGDRPH